MARVVNKTTLEHIELANTPDYPTDDWLINPSISIWDTVEKKYTKSDGTDVVEMNAGEKTAVDAAGLGALKIKRYAEIDANTSALIAVGFVFEGKTFSLSIPAQINWNTLKSNESDFSWPVEVTKLNNDSYSLLQNKLVSFWITGRDATVAHLDSGRALKKSIFDAADKAAVDAVVDTRT